MVTWKFMPIVAASPTTTTGRSTIGVRRTYEMPSRRLAITAPTERGRGIGGPP